MDGVLIIIALIAAYWIFIKNSSSATRKVTVTKRDTIKTENGTIEVEEIIKTDERKAVIGVYDDPIYKQAADRYRNQQELISKGEYRPVYHEEKKKTESLAKIASPKPQPSIPQPSSQVQRAQPISPPTQHVTKPANQSASKEASMTKVTTKTCEKCNKNKEADLFFHSEKNEDGLTKWCQECLIANRGVPQKQVKQESRHYKVCPKCNNRRLRTNFEKNSSRPDGLTKWCRYCLEKNR